MKKTVKRPTTAFSPKRRLLLAGAAVLAIFLFVSLFLFSNKSPSEENLLQAPPTPSATSKTITQRPIGFSPAIKNPGSEADQVPSEIAEKRLERARHTLEGYRQATRYPPSSRPLSEKPDLQKPHSVAQTVLPLARPDHKPTDARVTLSQDRLFLVGDEIAILTISCATSKGPAACDIQRAEAHVPESNAGATPIPPANVDFIAAAGDESKRIANFSPANSGFGGYHGTIEVTAAIRIAGEEGTATFDLVYTPAAPARFTGVIREALEDGSLCLYVQMDVTKAGRYVLAARVDEENGEGFAYLDFNELLSAGLQEAKMCIFGKLVLDEQAKSPFVLRDLEGFLLKEDTSPDRELMAAREGAIHTTKKYPESAFSDAEWQSEERARHIKEFENDVKKAEDGKDPP